MLVTLVAVLVLVLVGSAVLVVRPGPVAGWFGDDKGTAPTPAPRVAEPSPSPVLLAADQVSAPTAAGVTAAIQSLVTGAKLGGRLGVSVIDPATGDSLYGAKPEDLATPASTTKLVTAATALAALGPVHRIPTRVVAGSKPGEVVLIGGGDPTLAIDKTGTYAGAARLDLLATQVEKALGGTVPTRVIVDSTLFTGPVYGPGWDADIATGGYASAITALMTNGARIDPKEKAPAARHAEPDLAAGQAFAKKLGLPVSAVSRGTAPAAAGAGEDPSGSTEGSAGATPDAASSGQAAAPPKPGAELGRVESPPLLRLVEIMLSESDNVVAEALGRQVALAEDQPASFTGATAAMNEVLADLGLSAQESRLNDGSGLSRQNRLTPSLLTDLLELAASGRRPELTGVLSGLPVAGWSGTLEDRFQAPSGKGKAGVGVVRAKTGTLSGVHAMAGVVRTADGHTLVFAFVADGVTAGPWDAQAALDAIAAKLAGCGCG